MKRRTFLMLAGGGIAAAAAVPYALPRIEQRIVNLRRPRLEKGSSRGDLKPREMATVMALAEVLVPMDAGFEGIDDTIEKHVRERTTQTNGYLQEYRNAVALLDETAEGMSGRQGFLPLARAEREEVVDVLLWNYEADDEIVRRLERLVLPEEQLAFRRFVVRDILSAFFRKSRRAAWGIIGYAAFPGRPREPRDYSRMP